MRNTVLILLISALQVYATGSYAQTKTISLAMNDATISEVLYAIQNQSEFYFLYNSELIDVNKKVNIAIEEEKVDEILIRLFDKNEVDFLIKDRYIVLTPVGGDAELFAELQQQPAVSGTVTDESGQPLPGVTVVVKGTTQGTITNADGEYTLANIPDDATLVFSFVGMRTQEVAVGDQTRIDVRMVEETIGLEEVVAVGYGVQRKATLTGSVASVDAEFIESRPLTNSSQALQGVQGVYVNQAGGQPGSDNATIRIRGVGTFNNNNPLVLVDGIEYNLRDVNPNDIESISVLKDAASASIYGNRAANGVILITTKAGKKEKMKVELNSYFGVQQATYIPDMVTNSVDYMLARNQASVNENQPKPYSDEQIEEFRTGTDPDLYPNTDWMDILFSAASMNNHNLRLSGGNDKVTYALSLGYLDQEGVLLGYDAKNYTLNSHFNYNYSERLSFGAIINGSYWDRNEPAVNNNVLHIYRALPIHPNILSNGQYGDTWLITPGHNVFRHPVARAKEGIDNNKTQRAMINIFSEYTFPLDIKYKANFAVTKYDAYNHRFIPEIYIYNPKEPDVPKWLRWDPTNRSVQRTNNSNMDVSFFQTLNWDWQDISARHNVSLLLGFSRESFNRSNFNAYIEGFLGNELSELNAGTINKDVGGTSSESHLMSYFGRANYNFSEKYLLEFNFRYDGSSRFAKGNRWGFFPSVSAAWRISEESFFKNIDAFSDFKLRGSWGQLGNQNISLYSFVSNININQGTILGNDIVAGSAITTLADPNISWETTTMTNIGIDLNLWNNMLITNIDVFDKLTSDILARINVPAQVGNLNGPVTNLYSMANKGIEIALSHQHSIRDFQYKVGGNIAFVDNEVEYMAGDEQYTSNRYGNIRVIKEGYPVNSWYLYEAEGLFQSMEEVEEHAFQHPATSPGDIKYKDVNKDGKIDVDDMRVMGRSVPKFTYGFNMDFNYKGFDLNLFFQGVHDIDVYPWHNVAWPLFNGAGITKDQLENVWTPDNRDAKYPRLSLYKRGTEINSKNSTFWLRDASYLRMKNVQLGYTIQSQFLNKININKFRLYVNAQNPLTFSKYKISDPEKDILQQNIGNYPHSRVFSIGFNVIF